MLRWTPVLCVLVLAAWLLPAGPAHAVFPPAIKDDGKFFKAETLEKANKKIREIYQNYKKDVVIETIEALSADQEKTLKEEGREKFFKKLARDRAGTLGVNGIYILFSRSPQYFEIFIDPETEKKAFIDANYKTLRETIIKQFKARNFDGGLLDGLEFIESALKTNTK